MDSTRIIYTHLPTPTLTSSPSPFTRWTHFAKSIHKKVTFLLLACNSLELPIGKKRWRGFRNRMPSVGGKENDYKINFIKFNSRWTVNQPNYTPSKSSPILTNSDRRLQFDGFDHWYRYQWSNSIPST